MHCPPNSREKYLLQGLIQMTNAALKASTGMPGAAERLIALSEGLLEEAFRRDEGPVMGVAGRNVRNILRSLKEGFGGEKSEDKSIPVLEIE